MDLQNFFQPKLKSPPKRARLEQVNQEAESSASSAEESESDLTATPGETSSSNAKQAPTFRHAWLKGRQWLKFIAGKGMLCELCIKHDKRPFNRETWNTIPCTRYRLQSITMHERSAAHHDSVTLDLAAAATPTISQAIQLPEVPARGIEQAFSCLYFLVKQRIPHTTNFEPLLDLLHLMGIPTKADIHVTKNATYTSNKSIQEMLYCISEVIESKILNDLCESEHFSLMFDETTDCTITEQLTIHGRYISKQTGELKNCYLTTIDVLGPELEALRSCHDTESCISVGASTITKRILEFTDKASLDMTRLRGISTDGAATMIGCRTGVVVRLKELTPSAVTVHCAAHRLNLASSQAANKVQYVKKSEHSSPIV